jgi:hypothetical protein
MFNLEHALSEWRRQMAAGGIKSSETLKELESHLRDDVERQIRSGLSVELAFCSAVRQLGSVDALRGEFAKAARLSRRQIICRGLVLGVGVFLLGAAFCYFALLPAALGASQTYARWLGFSPVQWKVAEHGSFVLRFMLGVGLGFEIPVVILTLVKLGLLDYRSLSKARGFVIIVNLILGAVITTPELITQLLAFLPLQILYEASVWTAWRWEHLKKCES